MSAERLNALLSTCLDDDVSAGSLDELAALVRERPEHAAAFRKTMFFEELFSQQFGPRRGAGPFMDGLATRLRAERDGKAFVGGLQGQMGLGGRAAGPRRLRVGPAGGARVAAPVPGWHGAWRMTGLAALVLVGLGALFAARMGRLGLPGPVRPDAAPAGVAVVSGVEGGVLVERAGGRVPARVGQGLLGGDRLRTGDALSSAAVDFADGTRLELGPQTTLTAPAAVVAPPQMAFVEAGSVTAEVRPGRMEDVVLDTPHASVRVLGTRFTLRVAPALTRVDVERGLVEVTGKADGRVLAVPAWCHAEVGLRTLAASNPNFGNRVTDGLLALYSFQEGVGERVRDVSSVEPALDLRIPEPQAVRWRPGGGLVLLSPTLVASDSPAAKIVDACRRAGELTVEAWVTPATRQADPEETGRIVTVSRDADFRNITLEQGGERFRVRLRTTQTNLSGSPGVETTRWPERERLVHIVYCRNARGLAWFHANGRSVTRSRSKDADPDAAVPRENFPGDFSTWVDDLRLGLGNEFSGGRSWLGEYRLVAIYDRALSPAEILRNYQAGPPSLEPNAVAGP